MLEALLVYARHRQPLVFAALSMAGSTGPITLAGVLVHQTAELLAGIVLAQLISPGTPVRPRIHLYQPGHEDRRPGYRRPQLSMMIEARTLTCVAFTHCPRSGGALHRRPQPGCAGWL